MPYVIESFHSYWSFSHDDMVQVHKDSEIVNKHSCFVNTILLVSDHCLQHAIIVMITRRHCVVEFIFQSPITPCTLKNISWTIIFTKWLLQVSTHGFRLSRVYHCWWMIYITTCIKSLHIIYSFAHYNFNWNDNTFRLI